MKREMLCNTGVFFWIRGRGWASLDIGKAASNEKHMDVGQTAEVEAEE